MKRKPVDLARLCGAMQRARLTLRRYREERVDAVRQYVGSHWSEEGNDKPIPINMIGLYCSIVSRSLIPKSPRVCLSTFDKQNKAMVEAMETWVNRRIVEIRLANTLRRVVLDGLFSVGICKVGLASPADAAHYAWNLRAGQPFAERVDLDDFVFDVHARDFSEVSYIGHRFRVPADSVRDSSLYSKDRKDLTVSTDEAFNADGDERINILGRGYYTSSSEEFQDYVDLWEIYIPHKRLIITLPDQWLAGPDNQSNKPLREQEWLGPDCGPYHILGYEWVPGNVMPKGKISDIIDLHNMANSIYRKLWRQSDRQKQNTFVEGQATNDGERVMMASDGDIIKVDNAESIKVVDTNPGPSQPNILMFDNVWKMFNMVSGNIEMMGGLGPQSKTATQDKMLAANASALVTSMGEDTINFVEGVVGGMCWYWWNHPEETMRTKYALPGLPEMAIQRKVTPQMRAKMPYDELQLEIDPYSLQPQTPQTKVQAILEAVKTVQPFAQMAQSQGVVMDINVLLTKLSKYWDIPDLPEIFNMQEPPQGEPGQAQGTGGGQPAETTRNYVRRSQGADSQGSQQNDMMNQLSKMNGTNGQQVLSPAGAE